MFRTISKPTKALCSLQRSISTNYSRSMVTVSVPTNLATINSRSLPNHCNRVHNKFNFHSSSSRSFSESHDDFKPKRKGIPEGMEEVLSLIDKYVKENSVILFMKGTPQQPQCGFSLQTVRILNALGVEFSAINVLEYPALREGIKQYSEWPTIPQLFIAGEFIGGCDIVSSMYQDGELEKMLKDKKLIE